MFGCARVAVAGRSRLTGRRSRRRRVRRGFVDFSKPCERNKDKVLLQLLKVIRKFFKA